MDKVMTKGSDFDYTQCPGCASVFRVGKKHRSAARDRVRCGLCGEYFVAGAHLLAKPAVPAPVDTAGIEAAVSADTMQAADATDTEVRGGDRGDPRRRDAPRPRQAATAVPGDGSGGPVRRQSAHGGAVVAGHDWGDATRLAVEAGDGRRRRPRWRFWFVALALAAGLLVQVVWLSWDRVVESENLRPLAERWCAVAGCEVPVPRAPEQVEVLERTLREHPDVDDALLLTATLVNRLPRAQPWPELGLVLTALNGDVLAEQWFEARVYYHAFAPLPELMPAGRPVSVRLAFREPDREAVGFELRFR